MENYNVMERESKHSKYNHMLGNKLIILWVTWCQCDARHCSAYSV